MKFLKILFVLLLTNLASYSQISTKEVKELLDKYDIKHKDKVLKVAILETGWFKSNKAIKHKNLFGFETGKKRFISYDECVLAYKTRVESRMRKNENFYKFLKRIKYANDNKYIWKLKHIRI
jgi:flagellum-specific peptidoglycan hydrolase FlgJ